MEAEASARTAHHPEPPQDIRRIRRISFGRAKITIYISLQDQNNNRDNKCIAIQDVSLHCICKKSIFVVKMMIY